jgi:hypothetical protein
MRYEDNKGGGTKFLTSELETGRFDSTHNVCYVGGESEDHGRRRTRSLNWTEIKKRIPQVFSEI